MVEEFHCAGVIREFPLFFAELRGVGFAAAVRESHGMLQVEHLVVKDVGDDVFGNVFSVELTIDDDLLERGIEAAELTPPQALAPAEAWERERVAEVSAIEAREHWRQIVVRSGRAMLRAANALLAKFKETAARGGGVGKFAISLD